MAEPRKKRKRTGDEIVKPNKKVAIQAPKPVENVLVSVVPDTDDCVPIVVSTPGLAVPNSIGLQPYILRRKDATVRSGHGGSIEATEFLFQSSEHPTIDYLGREEGPGGTDSLLKHYIGVYDPTTGKLQVMEARKIVLRGTVRARQAEPEAMTEGDVLSNIRDLRSDLGQTFGTKKARKAIASLTENAISPLKTARHTSLGGTRNVELDSTARTILTSIEEATSGMATREELSAAVDNSKPRPKANLAAENIKDVYPIENVISVEILKLVPVKEWQDSVKAKKEIITRSKFVAHRLQRVALDVQKLRVLRYLLCMLEFFGTTRQRGRGARIVLKKEELRTALVGIPEVVVESIRRKFSVNGQMQKYQVDLLITHACVLALIVDNFEVDMYDLMEDLQLEVKEISQYFYEIGAKVVAASEVERKKLGIDKVTAAQHKIAKLKLPLDFPKAKFARRR